MVGTLRAILIFSGRSLAWLFKVVAVLLAILFFLGSLLMRACVSEEVVARTISPEGTFETILVETNGRATTSFGYSVRVRPVRGLLRPWKEVGGFYGATRSECAYGVNLRWYGARSLRLEYLEAKSVTVDPSVKVAGSTITLTLAPGVVDRSAPCGGMGYNLRGRPAAEVN